MATGLLCRLQAGPQELADALDVADEFSREYELPISCSIAMPPCLFDTAKYARLTFGFCSAGTERAYYTLDPLGNVRPCNHSPLILGNIRRTPFAEMAESPAMKLPSTDISPGVIIPAMNSLNAFAES